MSIHDILNPFLTFFRRRRMKRFASIHRLEEGTTILDVGGYPWFWGKYGTKGRVTVVNTDAPAAAFECPPNIRFLQADGCALPFAEKSFDVGFSNSVIEHLSTWENQRRFAAELGRVARGLWVQTPARCFPVEPHLLTPLIHFLPKCWQRPLLRHFTIWGWLTRPTDEQVKAFLAEVRLLAKREMKLLFPGCTIITERFLFWPKCYIAVKAGSG